MRNSLKTKLQKWLQQEGRISYLSLATECLKGKYGRLGKMYKVDTARRRIDEMMEFGHSNYNPNVALLKEGGIVAGWQWQGTPIEKILCYDLGDRVMRVKESFVPKLLLAHPFAKQIG